MQAQNWINSAKYNDLIATAVANKNIDLSLHSLSSISGNNVLTEHCQTTGL